MIPYGRQEITESDVRAVVDALRSDFLTQGPAIPRFESAVAGRVGASRAVAANSATAALHLACLALGVRPGDLLWTVPNTFVASANCGRYCGADVDFVDIDPATWNMSVPELEAKLARAKRSGRLPKVLVPVHFGGQPTQQEAIWELAQAHGIRVIEDASHSVGASRHDEPVGSCKWSDITVFSFHPVKIITTAEGGMALTNDATLAQRMTLLRSHGITRDPSQWGSRGPGADPETASDESVADKLSTYYEQHELGFNYRMPDILAALGLSQLARLDGYTSRRNSAAQRYSEILSGLPLRLPTVEEGNRSAFHLYVVRLRGDCRKTRRQVFEAMRTAGIGVNVHYMPVHMQPYYRELGFARGNFPEAEAHGAEAITLPLYPAMTDRDQEAVSVALHEVLGDR